MILLYAFYSSIVLFIASLVWLLFKMAAAEGRARSEFCLGCRHMRWKHDSVDECHHVSPHTGEPCRCPGGFQYVPRRHLP